MRKIARRIFDLFAWVAAVSIIILLVLITLPNYIKSCDRSLEVEAWANLHTIQIAVERYNTDHKEYPPYLLGGNREGWDAWHSLNDEPNPDPEYPANNWVHDPLIQYDYFTSYPENPFIDANAGRMIISSTNFDGQTDYGYGDPRFGYKGSIMGCGLDDPYFFENADLNLPYSRIETKRTLDRGKYDPTHYGYPSRNAKHRHFPGLYYNFGGRYDPKTDKQVRTIWPGSFFYRSMTDFIPKGDSIPYPNQYGHGRAGRPVHRYILGVWGEQRNPGKDIIRLQEVTPDKKQEQVYWRLAGPLSKEKFFACGYSGRMGKPMGLPAVFGGGSSIEGTFWPPDQDPDALRHYIYGAPDGVRDGIIHYLTSGSEKSIID